VLSLFACFANCLEDIKLATRIFKKVKSLAMREDADNAAITKIDRDIAGLENYPGNTCCVCMNEGMALLCNRCGISCYCSKRCQEADWKWNHKEVCDSMIRWGDFVFHQDD
jgi:hypothetical protein